MKQEKITPESFLKLDPRIFNSDPVVAEEAKWLSEQSFKLYQSALQQLLDEASEELPDENVKYPLTHWDGVVVQDIPNNKWRRESAKWMRSEAAKTVVKLKEENVKLNKLIDWWEENCGKWKSDCESKDKEIQQLKEELARKDGDIKLFAEWVSKRGHEYLPADRLLKKYEASKTDKP